MDADPEAEQAASKIFQTILIALIFSACNNSENKPTTVYPNKATVPAESTAAKKPVVALPEKKDTTAAKKRVIYLTFDDGPNKGTGNVMDIVREENVPITMFLIGRQVHDSKWQNTTFDSIASSHLIEIQNHSYTHAHNHFQKFYLSPASVIKDFIRSADTLRLGSKIIRTPGRNIWRLENISSTDIKQSAAAADSLRNDGFKLVGWDVEWRFDNHLKLEKTTDELLRQLDTLFTKEQMKIPGNLVLLAHDQSFADATDSTSLHNFIHKLKESDLYSFETISKYPAIKN